MTRRLIRPAAILALGLMLIPPPAIAAPRLDISWQTCTPSPINRDGGPGSVETIVVSATGMSGIIRGYEFEISLGTWGSTLAEAWRYQPGGCEAGRLTVRQQSGASCPTLTGAGATTLSAFTYAGGIAYGHLQYAAQFGSVTADPAKRYVLAQFDFDHGNAFLGGSSKPDSCGCIERPTYFEVNRTKYYDGSFGEHALDTGNFFLTWNDPGGRSIPPDLCDDCSVNPDTLCATATPAHARTWGQIKNAYRMLAR